MCTNSMMKPWNVGYVMGIDIMWFEMFNDGFLALGCQSYAVEYIYSVIKVHRL